MRPTLASCLYLALSGALWVALCDGRAGLGSPGAAAMLEKVNITGRFKVTESRVEVSYTVTNKAAEDIYLIDLAFRAVAGGVEVRPDHLLVSYEPPATVVLSSKLAALDPNAAWATPPVTYATRVRAGGTYSGVAGARIPLRVEAPSGSKRADAVSTREVSCNRLRFELGVIPHSADLQAQDMTLAGKEVCQLSAMALKHQRVESVTGDVSLRVTVPR